jgi:ESS family glutamate:Na+ symporter
MDIVISFSALCILLVVGKVLRVKVKVFQKLYLPASVIGGLVGLIVIQTLSGLRPDAATGGGGDFLIAWSDFFSSSATGGWNRLPGFLINIVFAALFLGVFIPPIKKIWETAGPQLAYGQIVAWGQYAVGVGIAIILLTPLFGVPAAIGTIIPVGFEGGHGTAAGMAGVFDRYGWVEGKDLALTSATCGVMFAIIVGMALVNWAARRGYTQRLKRIEDMPDSSIVGVYEVEERPSAGRQTVAAASVDSLGFHLALIGVGVFIGYLIKLGLIQLEVAIHPPAAGEKPFFDSFPLFPLCMMGGLVVQLFFANFTKLNPIDHQLMQRLSGTSMDFLVVAAISTINLQVVLADVVPLLILVVCGVLWNVFCVMWLARRLLPSDSWFERSIAEMGQSMGVTATGLLLLRVVDPEGETDATSAFGYKQLLHEPFMGGGLWTSAAIPLALAYNPGLVLGISVCAIVIWLIVWTALFRRRLAVT